MDSDVVCRTCFRQTKKYVSIFSAPELWGKNIVIAKLIMACAPIIIKIGDGLPSKICDCCLELLQLSFLFRLRAITANEHLKEIVQTQVLHGDRSSINTPTNLNRIYSSDYVVESIAVKNLRGIQTLKQEPLDIKEELKDTEEFPSNTSPASPSTRLTEKSQNQTQCNTLTKNPQNFQDHETPEKPQTQTQSNTLLKNPQIQEQNTKTPEKPQNKTQSNSLPKNPQSCEKNTNTVEKPQNQTQCNTLTKNTNTVEKPQTQTQSNTLPKNPQSHDKNTKTPESNTLRKNPQNQTQSNVLPKNPQSHEKNTKTLEKPQNQTQSNTLPKNPQNQVKPAKTAENNNETKSPEKTANTKNTRCAIKLYDSVNKKIITVVKHIEIESTENRRSTDNSNKNNSLSNETNANNTLNNSNEESTSDKEGDNSTTANKLQLKRTYSKIGQETPQLTIVPKVMKKIKLVKILNSKDIETENDVKPPTRMVHKNIDSNECIIIDDD